MQEFDGGSQQAQVIGLVTQRATAEQHQQRAQALAASGDDIVADLFHQRHAGNHLLANDAIDGGEIVRYHAVESLGLHRRLVLL